MLAEGHVVAAMTPGAGRSPGCTHGARPRHLPRRQADKSRVVAQRLGTIYARQRRRTPLPSNVSNGDSTDTGFPLLYTEPLRDVIARRMAVLILSP
jgi:hypothetical protein